MLFSAAASLFFSSCQAARASFEPLQMRRYAANDSSDGAKSAPSTSAISAVKVSFTTMRLAVFGVSRIGVASPCSAAIFASSASAATAIGSSLTLHQFGQPSAQYLRLLVADTAF